MRSFLFVLLSVLAVSTFCQSIGLSAGYSTGAILNGAQISFDRDFKITDGLMITPAFTYATGKHSYLAHSYNNDPGYLANSLLPEIGDLAIYAPSLISGNIATLNIFLLFDPFHLINPQSRHSLAIGVGTGYKIYSEISSISLNNDDLIHFSYKRNAGFEPLAARLQYSFQINSRLHLGVQSVLDTIDGDLQIFIGPRLSRMLN
ncbi:MAG: hypothetical protein JXQ90_19250 [Cyclobacteriaceae bacterium]